MPWICGAYDRSRMPDGVARIPQIGSALDQIRGEQLVQPLAECCIGDRLSGPVACGRRSRARRRVVFETIAVYQLKRAHAGERVLPRTLGKLCTAVENGRVERFFDSTHMNCVRVAAYAAARKRRSAVICPVGIPRTGTTCRAATVCAAPSTGWRAPTSSSRAPCSLPAGGSAPS